jgi:ABC-type cobalamin transport system ATPase subunit
MSTLPALTRVVLKDFRSIASCDVRLGQLTFLVGLNGAGKSNFIDALRLCRDALRNPLDQAFAGRAWYLAAAASLAGQRGLKAPLSPPANPEAIRGAKEWLTKNMTPGKKYSPAIDQPAFAATFDLEAARAAPSFAKLCRDILSLFDKR